MKWITAVLSIIILLCLPTISVAAPPEEELAEYLNKIEWTKDDLTSYLTSRHLDLNEFESMDSLIEVLGTPINESNVRHLLEKYRLSEDDLDDLLEQFGETKEDYTFVEELEVAVDFFQKHNEELNSITDFLGYVGMTEQEISNLFTHFVSLDQQQFLSKKNIINDRIDKFGKIDEAADMQEVKKKELLSILKDVFSAYQLTPSFLATAEINGFPQTVQIEDLSEIESIKESTIEVALQSDSGTLLADLTISSDMLQSDFVLQASEQLLNVGGLATGMSTMMNGDPIPATASSYPLKLSIGILLLLISCTFMLTSYRKQLKKQ